MVDIENSVVVRLKRGENKFEILADPDKALEFKKGEEIDINDVLAYPEIYKDFRAADLVPSEELQKNFGTIDALKIAEKILKEGQFQFTTEQRRIFLEDKKNEIIDIIARRAINPQTNTPHPPQRILNALEKAGVRIDPFINANLQVDTVVKALKVILPIKIESVVIQITIPAQYTGKIYSSLKQTKEKFEEQWLSDGSLQLILRVPAGVEAEILQKIGDITKGNFNSKTLERVEIHE